MRSRPRLSAASVPLSCKAKDWSASTRRSSHGVASVHGHLAAGLNDLAGALLKELVVLQVELRELLLLHDLPRSGGLRLGSACSTAEFRKMRTQSTIHDWGWVRDRQCGR